VGNNFPEVLQHDVHKRPSLPASPCQVTVAKLISLFTSEISNILFLFYDFPFHLSPYKFDRIILTVIRKELYDLMPPFIIGQLAKFIMSRMVPERDFL
jgi:hypothetical protein